MYPAAPYFCRSLHFLYVLLLLWRSAEAETRAPGEAAVTHREWLLAEYTGTTQGFLSTTGGPPANDLLIQASRGSPLPLRCTMHCWTTFCNPWHPGCRPYPQGNRWRRMIAPCDAHLESHATHNYFPSAATGNSCAIIVLRSATVARCVAKAKKGGKTM